MKKEIIQLGDEVRHPITGAKGVAVAKTTYISGCSRFTIQQKIKKDGELPEALVFDEPELELVKAKKQKRKTDLGGWKPNLRREQKSIKMY